MLKAEEIEMAFTKAGAAMVGVTSAAGLDDIAKKIEANAKLGYFGKMAWLERSAKKRANPEQLLTGAKNIICTAWPYSATPQNRHFARYSLSIDYHQVIKEKLKDAWRRISPIDEPIYSVDSKPIAEKPLAARAGLGWIGKNTLLINKEKGSYFCLGLIITKEEVSSPVSSGCKQEPDACGSCTKCIDACPTGAIVNPGKLDCTKCISYYTIEEKGDAPETIRPLIGEKVFGCDICQEVCPYNNNDLIKKIIPESKIQIEHIAELMPLDEDSFKEKFAGTVILRLGRERLLRNVAIALGNMKDKKAISFLEHSLHDRDSLVRRASTWALARIAEGKEQKLS